MRSDVKHWAPCGKESLYHCRRSRESFCPKIWPGCIYIPKTLETTKDKNKIHPISIRLAGLFMDALTSGLPNTAWCIDLAKTAIGWELIALAENKPELFVQNKIREKIEKDKGVLVR